MVSIYEIAEEFIQYTDCPVFVTGKAGSGKTTMLRQIKEGAFKQTVVVAPTGVAAINAGGTTIHSLFQLPFSPFIPTPEGKRGLIAKQQVSDVRRKVFRELELLIIDEVSMVRADLIDAIDTVLRHYRYRRNEPFGGVQVVYIGDMYQLPPVCIGNEWELLREYYPSPYFFHSQVVREQPPVYIELDKIFRQSNLQFVNLLNEVRNNNITPDTFHLLNLRYKPGYRARQGDGYITLTTHNASADAINSDELSKIDKPYYSFVAKINGDFPEKSYPTDVELQLKQGARVMFIANDMAQPRRYFNGKLGVITDIDDNEIWVTCDGEDEPIQVALEVWENKSYTINKSENKIDEKLLGTFTQYPLRLAWAITIHKSQGLTFEHVIIDAGAAFVSGQVYVALSRCRTLDGIILTSPINPNSLAVDPNIARYGERRLPNSELACQVEVFKQQYSLSLLSRLFSLEELMTQTAAFHRYITSILADFNEETAGYIDFLNRQVSGIYNVAQRFLVQLHSFDAQNDKSLVRQRVYAASEYYTAHLTDIIALIEASPAVTESKTEAQDYVERLKLIFETAHRLRSIMASIKDDMSVTNYFAAKQGCVIPKFKVKAYVVEREVKLLKTDHPELYTRLAHWRNDYCSENNIPVYIMFSNATLVEISNRLPLDASQLMQIKGLGKVKIERYGNYCLDIVRQYCSETGIDTDTQTCIFETGITAAETGSHDREETKRSKKGRRKRTGTSENAEATPTTEEHTLELLQQGKTVAEIASERGLSLSTIYRHAAQLIHKRLIDISLLVDNDTLHRVMRVLAEKPGQPNKELYEHFGGAVSYNEITLIRAYQLVSDEL